MTDESYNKLLKLASPAKRAYYVELNVSNSWKENRRAYRKKLIADGVVKTYPLYKGLYGVEVSGFCVGAWSSADIGHDIMDAVFDTIMALRGKV